MAKKVTSKKAKVVVVDANAVSFAKKKNVKKAFFLYHENLTWVKAKGDTASYVANYLNAIKNTSTGKSYASHQEFVADGGKLDGSNVAVVVVK